MFVNKMRYQIEFIVSKIENKDIRTGIIKEDEDNKEFCLLIVCINNGY